MSRILLGVAGGIAAYKACLLLRRFTEAGHDVRVLSRKPDRLPQHWRDRVEVSRGDATDDRALAAALDGVAEVHNELVLAEDKALDVFAAHRRAGDRVVVATGAPPELARAILAFVAHQDVPVVGSDGLQRLSEVMLRINS